MLFYTYTHLIIAAGKVQFCFLYYIVFSCSLFFLSSLVCSPRFCLAKMRFPRFSCCVLLIGQAVLKILLRHAFLRLLHARFCAVKRSAYPKSRFLYRCPCHAFPRLSSCLFSRFLRSDSLFFVCFNQRNARFPVCIAPGRACPLSTRCALVRPGSVKRAPSRYLFCSDFFFSFCIHFICFVFSCSSMQILFFSRINYAAHPSPSLHQRPFPFSEANPLRVFSCPLALFLPCSYALSCLRRLLCPVWFSQRKTPPRPRFLPFFAQNKRGRLALFFTVPYCFSCPPQSKAAGIFPRWRCALPAFY